MQPCGGFIEDVDRLAGLSLAQFLGQLDPLRFTTGLRCDVASRTSVCIDVDLVRELGSRTRMGVVWQL